MSEHEEAHSPQPSAAGLVACAYLPLSSSLTIGPWNLVELADFEGPWLNERFERLAKHLLERHLDPNGKPVDRPSLLVRSDTGADGSFPQEHEYVAVQQSLNFGVLDANPRWKEEADNLGWFTFTADNAELRLWEIRDDTDLVVLHSGSMVRLTTMGRGIEDSDFAIPAALELRMPMTTAWPDEDVVAALYEVGMRVDEGGTEAELAARVMTSIRWLSKAWWNTPSIDWFDRVVFLRTGFESLFGVSGTPKLRLLLRELFESLGASEEAADELHWSPLEEEERPHPRADWNLTDLEHWFQCFSDTRNEIVHEGGEPNLVYVEEGSAYRGPYPQVAQQVLRDAIRSFVTKNLGYKDLWRSSTYRKLAAMFDDQDESS